MTRRLFAASTARDYEWRGRWPDDFSDDLPAPKHMVAGENVALAGHGPHAEPFTHAFYLHLFCYECIVCACSDPPSSFCHRALGPFFAQTCARHLLRSSSGLFARCLGWIRKRSISRNRSWKFSFNADDIVHCAINPVAMGIILVSMYATSRCLTLNGVCDAFNIVAIDISVTNLGSVEIEFLFLRCICFLKCW